jgi:hypothetical protein
VLLLEGKEDVAQTKQSQPTMPMPQVLMKQHPAPPLKHDVPDDLSAGVERKMPSPLQAIPPH